MRWAFNEMKETHDSAHRAGISPVSVPTDLNLYLMNIKDQ